MSLETVELLPPEKLHCRVEATERESHALLNALARHPHPSSISEAMLRLNTSVTPTQA